MRKTLKERVLALLESKCLNAVELADRLETRPSHLYLRELEKEGLIKWDKDKHGFRLVKR